MMQTDLCEIEMISILYLFFFGMMRNEIEMKFNKQN